MDHLFRFLGLGAAIVRREELPRSAPRAPDLDAQRLLLQAAEESTPLNKGESINALEHAVFYGNEGRIRLQTGPPEHPGRRPGPRLGRNRSPGTRTT
jgi:hypothetical protein